MPCQPRLNPQQHARDPIFLPQVQPVSTRLGLLHPDRWLMGRAGLCPDEIASRVVHFL